MASFDFDQAEGLRRMLAGPKPRVVTFLSTMPASDKSAMLVNLGASLAQAGSDVLLVDACGGLDGIASHLGAVNGMTLQHVARQECSLDQVVNKMPQGFGLVELNRCTVRPARPLPDQSRRVNHAFDILVKRSGIVLVDGESGGDDDDEPFPLPLMASSEIVLQVSASAGSIKGAYSVIKMLSSQLGRRPFSILVTGASENEAKVVYDNMAQAASRYLAVQLNSVGSVPADEHLNKAARLGRTVVDAFPLAGASVAFRRLAGRFVLPVAQGARTMDGARFGT
ncbi:MAG: antiactivator of flagellar biosynthesis FleN protein [Pseudomonadota bacterium]